MPPQTELHIEPARIGEQVSLLMPSLGTQPARIIGVHDDDPDGLTIDVETESAIGVVRLDRLRYGASDGTRPGWARPDAIRRERERLIAEQAAEAVRIAEAEAEAKSPAAIARRKHLGPQLGDEVFIYVLDGADMNLKPYRGIVTGPGIKGDCMSVKIRYSDGTGPPNEPPSVPYGPGLRGHWSWMDEYRPARPMSRLEMEPTQPCATCAESAPRYSLVPVAVGAQDGKFSPLVCNKCADTLRALLSGADDEDALRELFAGRAAAR